MFFILSCGLGATNTWARRFERPDDLVATRCRTTDGWWYRRFIGENPYAVRAIGKQGSWSGIVYSRFSASEAEEVIDYEIDYFGKLNRGFEWKVNSHDDPSDLLARLRLRGFAIGEEEGPNDPRFGGVAASPASTTTGRCHQRAGAGRFRNRRFTGSGSCDLGAVTYDPRVPPG